MAEATTKNIYKDIKDLNSIKPFDPSLGTRQKNKIPSKRIIKIILLILLLVSLVRVPYSGSYIDAYFYDHHYLLIRVIFYLLLILNLHALI